MRGRGHLSAGIRSKRVKNLGRGAAKHHRGEACYSQRNRSSFGWHAHTLQKNFRTAPACPDRKIRAFWSCKAAGFEFAFYVRPAVAAKNLACSPSALCFCRHATIVPVYKGVFRIGNERRCFPLVSEDIRQQVGRRALPQFCWRSGLLNGNSPQPSRL